MVYLVLTFSQLQMLSKDQQPPTLSQATLTHALNVSGCYSPDLMHKIHDLPCCCRFRALSLTSIWSFSLFAILKLLYQFQLMFI